MKLSNIYSRVDLADLRTGVDRMGIPNATEHRRRSKAPAIYGP
jgi:hypothetical protein